MKYNQRLKVNEPIRMAFRTTTLSACLASRLRKKDALNVHGKSSNLTKKNIAHLVSEP